MLLSLGGSTHFSHRHGGCGGLKAECLFNGPWLRKLSFPRLLFSSELSPTNNWSIWSCKDPSIAFSIAVPERPFQPQNSLWDWLTLLQMYPSVAQRNVLLFSLLNPASFTSLQIFLLSFSQINHLCANTSVSWGTKLQERKEKMWKVLSCFSKCPGLKATRITFTDNS